MKNVDVLNCGCFFAIHSSFYILPSGWRFFSSLPVMLTPARPLPLAPRGAR